MQKDLDENSYEKRIENIEKGKSYLKNNGFFDRNTYYNLIDYALKNEFIENNSLYVPSRNLNHIIGKIA